MADRLHMLANFAPLRAALLGALVLSAGCDLVSSGRSKAASEAVAAKAQAGGAAAASDFESLPSLLEEPLRIAVDGKPLAEIAAAGVASASRQAAPELPDAQGMVRLLLSGAQVANAAALESVLRRLTGSATSGTGVLRQWRATPGGKLDLQRQFASNSFERVCAPQDIGDYSLLEVLTDVTQIAVQTAGGDWLTVAEYPSGRVIDLMKLRNGTVEDLGAFSLAPGHYTQIRLRVGADNFARIDQDGVGSLWPLYIPDGDSAGVTLPHELLVTALGVTTLTLNFDPNASVGFDIPEQRFTLDPVIAVAADQTNTAVSLMVDAAAGATLRILGDFTLTIPPGALAHDTTISVVPTYRLGAHADANLLTIGQEYRIEPADTQLSAPATIQVSYRDAYRLMGLDAASYQLMTRAAGAPGWSALASSVDDERNLLTASIQTLGTVAIGGIPDGYAFSGGGCYFMASGLQAEAARDGVDANWFHAACDRHALCYAHGYATYRKGASACEDDFLVEALARCDSLSSDAELQARCQLLAASLHAQAVSTQATSYPGDTASSCSDYEALGVACAAPTCSITAAPAFLWANVVMDLDLAVAVSGSFYAATLDGALMASSPSPALPVHTDFQVSYVGLKQPSDREFHVSLESPSGEPAGCSLTLPVRPLVGCDLRVAPSPWTLGALPRPVVTMMMAPNIVSAQIDLVTEGVYGSPGLRTNADGLKFFTSPIHTSTTATRVYHGRVVDSAGVQHLCEDILIVNP